MKTGGLCPFAQNLHIVHVKSTSVIYQDVSFRHNLTRTPMLWLYGDFHIQMTRRDGEYPIDDLVDLYGQAGFDVIAISDHIPDTAGIERYGRLAPEPSSMERKAPPAFMENAPAMRKECQISQSVCQKV
jgi:hypothetical protein